MKPRIRFTESPFGDCARFTYTWFTPTTVLHNISTVASKHTLPRSIYEYRARSKGIRAFNILQPSCLHSNETLAKLFPLVLSLSVDRASCYPRVLRYKAALGRLHYVHISSTQRKREISQIAAHFTIVCLKREVRLARRFWSTHRHICRF